VRKARFVLAATLAALIPALALAAPFDEGERLFRDDKPAQAASLLERAIQDPGADERAWLYLALCYQQQGRLDDALATLRKGLGQASRFKALFYFDMGNIFILQGKNAFAIEMYGQALDVDSSLSAAYLNRANARLSTKDYPGARDDYRQYLSLEPGAAQRASIEELIKRLEAGLAETERLAAEAEAKKEADAAAHQAFLDTMSASLKAAADETTNLSAGAGTVQGYSDEPKVDE
jgi:tetratricopeptide (TPR) repeat protein